jgi:hypothetical protein
MEKTIEEKYNKLVEQRRIARAKWAKNNKTHLSKNSAKYYEKNKEQVLAKMRERYHNNKNKLNENIVAPIQ